MNKLELPVFGFGVCRIVLQVLDKESLDCQCRRRTRLTCDLVDAIDLGYPSCAGIPTLPNLGIFT